ncbi:thiol reductant ABC exporter subunit CydC [Acetonema longum]|uniref:ABC transporter, transmembrane region, type 1 n=1 Tax=Acetonema longum DSM 6540 TaxID=1009370 RepID=F7NKU1_9FIRM|nr:thiol reductant ABC exporter subunit CydC [Acetonema longum]EGO63395.1 ABC transporter, transmembrane region, type 1 [Acetonema longum DSM 6540]
MREWLRLMSWARQDWKGLVPAAVAAVMTVFSHAGLLAAGAYLLSLAALQPPIGALSAAVAAVRFFGLSRAVCRYLERWSAHRVTFDLLAKLRVKYYQRLEQAPAKAVSAVNGALLERLTGDVEVLQYFYLRVLLPAVVAGAALLGIWLFLGQFSQGLPLAVTLFFLLTGLGLPALLRRLEQPHEEQIQEKREQFCAVLTDALAGMTEIHAGSRQTVWRERLVRAGGELAAAQEQRFRLAGLQDAGCGFLTQAAISAVLVLAAAGVRGGEIRGVHLAMLVLAVWSMFEAAQPLSHIFGHSRETLAAAGRLFGSGEDVRPASGMKSGHWQPSSVETGHSRLLVKDLTVRYQEAGQNALEQVSLDLPPGRKLAVVGSSGAGKSTLLSVLLGLWPYQEGSATLDGLELSEWDPDRLCSHFSVVTQDTYLFAASLRDNILLARPRASEAELAAAVSLASLDGLVARLPRGLDTVPGQNGRTLSGGERQRVAIARAYLKAAPVWLLDEPTNGLDAATAAAIMHSILTLAGDKTVLMATHRLVETKLMDEILVLDGGRVAEKGNFQSLTATGGLFGRLWRLEQDRLQ